MTFLKSENSKKLEVWFLTRAYKGFCLERNTVTQAQNWLTSYEKDIKISVSPDDWKVTDPAKENMGIKCPTMV